MQAYGRTYESPKARSYRQKVETWDAFADALAHKPDATQLLLQAIREKRPDPLVISVDVQAEQLMQQLASLKALSITGKGTRKLSCVIASSEHLEFLRWDWLVGYVWKEVNHV